MASPVAEEIEPGSERAQAPARARDENEEERDADERRLVLVERRDAAEGAACDRQGEAEEHAAVAPRRTEDAPDCQRRREVHQQLAVDRERVGRDAGGAGDCVEEGRERGEGRGEHLARDGVQGHAGEHDDDEAEQVHAGHDGSERPAEVCDQRVDRAVGVGEARGLVVDGVPVHHAAAHHDLRHGVVDGLVVRDERIAEGRQPEPDRDEARQPETPCARVLSCLRSCHGSLEHVVCKPQRTS